MVFEGTTGVYERICPINSKRITNLSNDTIISVLPGLKTGMGFRGQV